MPALESWRPPGGLWRPPLRGPSLGHRRRSRGQGTHAPLKFGKKYFSVNYHVKFGHFSGKNHAKFGNFVNFSEKYLIIRVFFFIFSGKNRVKFGHFVNFSYIFFGQKCHAPVKLTELLRLCPGASKRPLRPSAPPPSAAPPSGPQLYLGTPNIQL